ncbi:MAG: hypothetical protein MUF82_01175, partial [Bacteroidetes bacterium]|nr:hypothetical protein [Bacteroidota bacterium]
MAKEYLLAADKYVKAGQFEKARDQIEKARAADPGNPYIPAFEERIRHFEVQQKQKPAPPPPPPPPAPPKPLAAPTAPPVMPPPPAPPPIAVPAQKPEPVREDIPNTPPPKPTPQKPVPPPEPLHSVTLTEPQQPPLQKSTPRPAPSITLPPPPRMEDFTPEPAIPEPIIPRQSMSRESDVVRRTQSITYMPPEETPPRPAPVADSGLNDQIAEMRRQLQELTSALQHERKAREEVLKQQLESTVRQYRSALEKAWQFGAPKAKDVDEIVRLAQSLSIPTDVEASITREVKLMMYGRAVKEVIAKRKNLKSSSSTLEWLRKVYQISLNEYLEYESQFLMDLVSDQFRGTMLFVATDEKIRADLVHRFKSSGFAVVLALNP